MVEIKCDIATAERVCCAIINEAPLKSLADILKLEIEREKKYPKMSERSIISAAQKYAASVSKEALESMLEKAFIEGIKEVYRRQAND